VLGPWLVHVSGPHTAYLKGSPLLTVRGRLGLACRMGALLRVRESMKLLTGLGWLPSSWCAGLGR
jgi:hypothetical protein